MFSAFVVISMKPLPFYKQQYDLPFMFNILSIVCFPAQVYLAWHDHWCIPSSFCSDFEKTGI